MNLKSTLHSLNQMHATLPWRNTLAMTSNMNKELPPAVSRWVTSGRRDYSTMPAVLRMADGTPVTTPEKFAERRREILALFEEHVYGALPKSGFTTSFEILEEGPALEGAALRRQVKLTVITGRGSSEALMLLYLPVQTESEDGDLPTGETDAAGIGEAGKYPVILGLNFNGNHTVLDDPAILPSLSYMKKEAGSGLPEGIQISEEMLAKLAQMDAVGGATEQWNVAGAIARGYGVASIYCNDFAPDNRDTYASRVIDLFDEPDFKAVGAWAFGLMRGIDYLIRDPQVDGNRLALIGHSRLGKAAVWAGANDERVALVISNDSGCTGSSLSRGNRGETVKSITGSFPYWFGEKYASYGDRIGDLPVDQHMLLACIAPRKVYVACAEGDLWADPQGSWNALMMSRKAFKLHGLEILNQGVKSADIMKMPAADGFAHFSESMGFHVRKGWHDVKAEDWEHYLDYMDEYVK